MEFTINRASRKDIDYPGAEKIKDRWGNQYTIEINSLEDLAELEKVFNEKLIISFRHKDITIYDCYME